MSFWFSLTILAEETVHYCESLPEIKSLIISKADSWRLNGKRTSDNFHLEVENFSSKGKLITVFRLRRTRYSLVWLHWFKSSKLLSEMPFNILKQFSTMS